MTEKIDIFFALEKLGARIKNPKISLDELTSILEESLCLSTDILKMLDKSNFAIKILKKDSNGNVYKEEEFDGTTIAYNRETMV